MSTDYLGRRNADQALDQLGRLSLRETSMEGLLQSVAELAKRVMPGDPEISVSVLIKRIPTTVVSTGQLAIDCDESQYGRGDGPCLHAARTGELTEVADTRTATRWRDYARQAVERGALGSLSVPLPMGDEGLSAALNVYARTAHAFDEESRSVASRFASYAAVGVANMQAYQEARKLADDLQAALDARAVIDQAKGILMDRHGLTADQAFQVLAQASMHTDTKVRDLAEHLVVSGELPLPQTPNHDR